MNDEAVATSLEDCLDALGHVQRRRLLLELLNDTPREDQTVVLDDLYSNADDRSRRLSLRHAHLPKLEKMGFIDTDQQPQVVTTGPHFDEIRPLLELLDDNRDKIPDGWV